MKPGSTQLAIWQSYFQSRGQRSTGHFHVTIRNKYADPGTGYPASPAKKRVYHNLLPGIGPGGSSADRRIPDGYVPESPGERNEAILNHTDFQSVEKRLAERETWEQTVESIFLRAIIEERLREK